MQLINKFKISIIRDFLKVGIVYFAAIISLFLSDIIFARFLDIETFGKIVFFKQSIMFLMTTSFLGLDGSIARIIGKNSFEIFRWKKFLGISAIFIFLISFITSYGFYIYYKLNLLEFTGIFICGSLGSLSLMGSTFLWMEKNYFKSQFLTQFWRFVLLFTSLSCFFSLKHISSIMIFIILGFLINGFLTFFFLRVFKEGKIEIPLKRAYGEGFLFWVNSGVLSLTGLADQFIITKMLGYSTLALYSAGWNVIGIAFILIATTTNYVLVPRLLKGDKNLLSSKRLIGTFILFILCLSLVIIFTYKPLLMIIYNNKYQIDFSMALVFVIIGSLRIIYVIPSTIITVWATTREIGIFSFTGVLGVALNIVIGVLLVPSLGIIGAGVGSLVGWLFRIILGMFLIDSQRKRRYLSATPASS
jgi:O-antigen/teichoic acid export membrane protein